MELLERVRHELAVTDLLFACDNEEGKELFRIEHTELIHELDKFIESVQDHSSTQLTVTLSSVNV